MGTGAFNVVWPQALVKQTNSVVNSYILYNHLNDRAKYTAQFLYNTVSYTASTQYKNAITPSIYSLVRSIWLIHGVKKQANT